MLNTPEDTVTPNEAYPRHPTIPVATTALLTNAMLLTALLIAQASADWVEISQQHYRNPLRTYQFTTKANDLEDTTKPWYNNHSVTDYNWDIEVIKRGDQYRKESGDRNTGFQDYEPEKYSYGSTIATDGESALKGTVERVPNVGNVRRVQLSNSPVKSPNIKWKTDRDNYPYIIDKDDTERGVLEETTNKQAYSYRHSINNINFPHTTTRIPFLKNDKDGMLLTDAPVENKKAKQEFNNYTAINSPNRVFLTEDFRDNDKEGSREKYNHNRKTEDVYPNEDTDTEKSTEIIKQTHKYKPNDIETKQNNQPFTGNPDPDEIKIDDFQTKSDEAKGPHRKQDNNNLKGLNIKANKTTSKVDTLENMTKLMMLIADTISKNSRRTVNGKMQYLQALKNIILANIEDRIDATWPDDSAPSGSARRRSRSVHAQAEPRGHVEFPSSEGSLMTISFLTFAVFLIKLVLQLIQTYKNKSMMVAPLVVAAAGRAAFAQHKHN